MTIPTASRLGVPVFRKKSEKVSIVSIKELISHRSEEESTTNFSKMISERLDSLNRYNILCSRSPSVVFQFFEDISESPVQVFSFYAYSCNLNVLEGLFTICVGKMLKTCLKVTSNGPDCRIDSKVPNFWAHTLLTIS